MTGGFNPGGAYLIRVREASLERPASLFETVYEDRGAASVPRYLIPWGRLYRPPNATGQSISELPDGAYVVEVWAVSGRPSSADECRAIDSGETLHMIIRGNRVAITQADGTTINSVIGG